MSEVHRLRFIQKLTEQLSFIHRSCLAFDQGAEDEAIRIAVALRVIFHTTSKSKSLLTHLGIADSKMLSSSRGRGDDKDYLGFQIDLSSTQPLRAIPLLENKFIERSFADWWRNETIFVYNGNAYSRRHIVLSAANKDGGAHVDEILEDYYKALIEAGKFLSITGNLEYEGIPPFPQGVPVYPQNAHLALLRQFAFEALNSASYFKWLKSL